MLRADSMPCAHDAALEQADGFDGVGVGVSHNINPAAVINRFKVVCTGYSAALHCERVGCEIIRHNHIHVTAHILADVAG